MSRNSVKSPFVPQLKTTDISALLKHFKQPFLRTCTESMLIKLHVLLNCFTLTQFITHLIFCKMKLKKEDNIRQSKGKLRNIQQADTT